MHRPMYINGQITSYEQGPTCTGWYVIQVLPAWVGSKPYCQFFLRNTIVTMSVYAVSLANTDHNILRDYVKSYAIVLLWRVLD